MIHCRIQAHPSRTHLQERLLRLLKPLPVEVMVHESDPPNPWEGYKKCLQNAPNENTHLIILQDDVIPSVGFADAVTRIASRHPDTPVCLFMGALPSSTAALARRAKPDVRYVPLTVGSFVPLVAVLWPTHVARAFLDWSARARGMTRADDGNAAKWARATRQQILVAVPSIVQHDDGTPSVKGGRAHVPWAEGWRQALFLANDAADYDW